MYKISNTINFEFPTEKNVRIKYLFYYCRQLLIAIKKYDLNNSYGSISKNISNTFIKQ